MYTDKPASFKSKDSFQRYEFAKRIESINIHKLHYDNIIDSYLAFYNTNNY